MRAFTAPFEREASNEIKINIYNSILQKIYFPFNVKYNK
jgi:hypothetical protein